MISRVPESEFQADEDAVECPVCRSEFTLFTRKHHCRLCGLVFCDSCTAYRIDVSTEPDPNERDTIASLFGLGVVSESLRSCEDCFVWTEQQQRQLEEVRQAEQVLTKTREKSTYGQNEGDDGYDPTDIMGSGGGGDDDDGFGGGRGGSGGNFWDGVTSLLGRPKEEEDDDGRTGPSTLWQDHAEPHSNDDHEIGIGANAYSNRLGARARGGGGDGVAERRERVRSGGSASAGTIFTVDAENPSDRYGPALWSLLLEAPSEEEAERWTKAMSRLRDWDQEAVSELERFKRGETGAYSEQGVSSSWRPAASPPKPIAGNLHQRVKRGDRMMWEARWVVAKIERRDVSGANPGVSSRDWARGDWAATITIADSPQDLREATALIAENAESFRSWVRSRNGPGYIGNAVDVMASVRPVEPRGGGEPPKPVVAVYNLRQADDIIVSQFTGVGSRAQWEAWERKEIESGRSGGYGGGVGDVDGSVHTWDGTPSQADPHSTAPHDKPDWPPQAPHRTDAGRPVPHELPLRWQCSVCTFDNLTASHPNTCEMCGAPGGPPPPPPPPVPPAPLPAPKPTAPTPRPQNDRRESLRSNGQRRDSWALDASADDAKGAYVREEANYDRARSAAEAMKLRDRQERDRGDRMSESMSQAGDGSQWETGSVVSSVKSGAARRRRAAQQRQGGRRRSKQDIKKGGVAAAKSGGRRPSASLTPKGRRHDIPQGQEGQDKGAQSPPQTQTQPQAAAASQPPAEPRTQPQSQPQSQSQTQSHPVPSLWSDDEEEDAPAPSPATNAARQPAPQPAPTARRAIAGGVALPGFPARASPATASEAVTPATDVTTGNNHKEEADDQQVPAPAPFAPAAASSQVFKGEMIPIRSHTRFREFFYMLSVGVSVEVVSRQMRDIGLDERVLSLDVATQVPSDCDDVMSWLHGSPPTAPSTTPAVSATPSLEVSGERGPPPLPPTPPPGPPTPPPGKGGSELAVELAESIKREALEENWDQVGALLRRASKLTVTVELLQASGIGRVVGALVRAPDEKTQLLAREIVRNWKGAVKRR